MLTLLSHTAVTLRRINAVRAAAFTSLIKVKQLVGWEDIDACWRGGRRSMTPAGDGFGLADQWSS
jgi:hypothetical protein